MTFEDLMAMKRVSDPQVSPSGKWVLFSVTDVSLAANTKVNHLWVVSIGGGGEKQVTFGAGRVERTLFPRWQAVFSHRRGPGRAVRMGRSGRDHEGHGHDEPR